MKAKDYEKRLRDAETPDAFGEALDSTLRELANDAQHLIKIRHAKSDSAISAIINEVNGKWCAIVRGINADPIGFGVDDGYETIQLDDDGFRAAFVTIFPKYKWAFDVAKHVKRMEEHQKHNDEVAKMREKAAEHFTPYRCTPYEELTMDTLVTEIMCRTMALGQYFELGFTIHMLEPLTSSIYLLRYWKERGAIDLADVAPFEENSRDWIHEHYIGPGTINPKYLP